MKRIRGLIDWKSRVRYTGLPMYACYFSDDNKRIIIGDALSKALRLVEYSDELETCFIVHEETRRSIEEELHP